MLAVLLFACQFSRLNTVLLFFLLWAQILVGIEVSQLFNLIKQDLGKPIKGHYWITAGKPNGQLYLFP